METYSTGDILDDIWVVDTAIGSGGTASVYRCHNRHAPRISAAIKLLGEAMRARPKARARLVREAEVLFSLDHPNIVKVRNLRTDARTPYLEMEFVEGPSLEREIMDTGRIEIDRALLFAAQLASAVCYLHGRNVCHRDIKPANLVVWRGTVLKLVDFGLVIEAGAERITETGTTFGTVSYAPPEWTRPEELDPVSWDLYAIGVVLYEMLTGTAAFPHPPHISVWQAVIAVMHDKQGVEHLDPGRGFPDDVRDLVRSMTARDPTVRPTSAHEVVTRLGQLLDARGLDPHQPLAHALAMEARSSLYPNGRPQHRSANGVAALSTLSDLNHAPRRTRRASPHLFQWLLLGAGGLAIVAGLGMLAFAAVLAGMPGLTSWLEPVEPPPPPVVERPVAVRVTGEWDPTHVGLRLDGLPPMRQSDAWASFPPRAPGPVEITWSAGPGCASARCPGDGCDVWCLSGAVTAVVDEGVGEATLTLPLPAVPRRALEVAIAGRSRDPVQVRVDGQDHALTDGLAAVEVAPGHHRVTAWAGRCPPDVDVCTVARSCPDRCASIGADVLVEATVDPARITLELPSRASTPAVARKPGSLVTRSAFAAWVRAHPEWARDAAIASGQAEQSYLRGFDFANPGDGPVRGVPVTAATAYCASRGGLAGVNAPPTTWADEPSVPFQEWRQDTSGPAWRRFDGATSDRMRRTEANEFTGFRCAR